MEVSYLRTKPLLCRVRLHDWTKWYPVNVYRRYEPVAGAEGIIVARNSQEHRCLACGERKSELGEERRLLPEDAIARGVLNEYERRNLRRWPLSSGSDWVDWSRKCTEPLGLPGLLCRIGVHRWFTPGYRLAGCLRCGFAKGDSW